MASYTATEAKHATLVASTVDTVTFPVNYARVEVLSRGSDAVYFTVDGTAPAVGGDNTYVATGGGGVIVPTRGQQAATVVKIISAGATAYSVRGL